MRTAELMQELRLNGLRLFTPKDAARITGKSIGYIYLFLSKNSSFTRVQNGLYCLPGTDPLEIASNIVAPSYISLVSAFSYYNLIDQVPNTIKVVAVKRHAAISSLNTTIEFRSVKKEMMYGYNRVRGVLIADPEKAIVDALYLGEDVRYIDEALENASESGAIDAGKLRGYAERSGVGSIRDKVVKLLVAE